MPVLVSLRSRCIQMVRSVLILVGLLFLVCNGGSPCFAADGVPVPTDKQIAQMIKDRVNSHACRGIVVGVVHPDGSRRIFAYGDPGEGARPLDGDSVFGIASVTKTFTATILADMVVKGEVALDDPVEKYLPTGTTMPKWENLEITLQNLALHESGLPFFPSNLGDRMDPSRYSHYTNEKMFAFLSSYTLPRAIGERHEYSNLGMGLLGQALALRAEMPYSQLVQKRICRPLGMKSTGITLTNAMRKRLAPGHRSDGTPVEQGGMPALQAAGDLYSTANDLLKFVAANLGASKTALQPAMDLAHISRRPIDGSQLHYTSGLAWFILPFNEQNIIWHGGTSLGYNSFIGFNKATGEGVVVLTNSPDTVHEIGWYILDTRAGPINPIPAYKQKQAAVVDPRAYDAVLGTYTLPANEALWIEAGDTLTILRKDGNLFAQLTPGDTVRLFPESARKCFFQAFDGDITFEPTAEGTVMELKYRDGGETLRAIRQR